MFLVSFSGHCPARAATARPAPCPPPCPEAAAMGSPRSLFPGLGAGSLTCLTNNILRIDCHSSAPELGEGPSPWLLFTSTCTVQLPPEEVISPFDNFTITLHQGIAGKEQVSLVDPQYLPRRHVKLDPLSDLQSNVSSDSCVLSWSINPTLEPLASLLSYELAFKRREEAWEHARHKEHIDGVTWLRLEAAELDPGAMYEARLRVQMATPAGAVAEEESYEGQWSEWSQPVSFPSPQSPGPVTRPSGHSNSTFVAVSIFFLLTCLTYLLFKLSARVKRTFYKHVPSPVAFFQPLYSVHNGNFQTWTWAHRAGVQLSQHCIGTPQGVAKSSVREAIAFLTCDPVDPWPPVALEEVEGSGTGLPTDVLPAAVLEWAGQPPAYLPQEEWGPASLARLSPPQPEGNSSDYCALACYGGGHPLTFPGNTQSSGPVLASACGLSCDQQSLDAWQGGSCAGAGHCHRRDPGERATGGPLGCFPAPCPWQPVGSVLKVLEP
uniref:Interleukin 9 receptor n=1 Tax=Rhinolophus ferrumequinum TaxID=59479 RepID=A0A671G7K8_RHIFE